MELLNPLTRYTPVNPQEARARQQFLTLLQSGQELYTR